ncbi:hypothetical protein GBF38_009862 [Nibea albiflora]|uniref:Uncharacterized protein n=1 Tax=Nibea albiflora TaxID=240163 RepID=A0ACB7F9V8_NIBAL|nr:hypothetical protein GBF38_009862 [Nibea albiflora]
MHAGAFTAFPHTRVHKDRAPALPPTSPALLLVVLAEDAALGVGERCRVTRAMVGGLQPWWRAAEEEEEEEKRREGRGGGGRGGCGKMRR